MREDQPQVPVEVTAEPEAEVQQNPLSKCLGLSEALSEQIIAEVEGLRAITEQEIQWGKLIERVKVRIRVKNDTKYSVFAYPSSRFKLIYPEGKAEFMSIKRQNNQLQNTGRLPGSYNVEDQPWVITVRTACKVVKDLGFKQGNFDDHCKYYVCSRNAGAIVLEPLREYYRVRSIPNFPSLTYEEAEKKFKNRGRIKNFFGIMEAQRKVKEAKKARKRADKEEEILYGLGHPGVSNHLILTENELESRLDSDSDDTDENEFVCDSNESEPESATDIKERKKARREQAKKKEHATRIVARKRRGTRLRKLRRRRCNAALSSDDEGDCNDEGFEESESDDHKGDEVDYMTDSSSDEDKLPEEHREEIYRECGVDEEVAMKALLEDISDTGDGESTVNGSTSDSGENAETKQRKRRMSNETTSPQAGPSTSAPKRIRLAAQSSPCENKEGKTS